MGLMWSESWGSGFLAVRLADSWGSRMAVGDSGFLTIRLADSWGSEGLAVGDSGFLTVSLADSWSSGGLTVGDTGFLTVNWLTVVAQAVWQLGTRAF
jgi:hypothetical protein